MFKLHNGHINEVLSLRNGYFKGKGILIFVPLDGKATFGYVDDSYKVDLLTYSGLRYEAIAFILGEYSEEVYLSINGYNLNI